MRILVAESDPQLAGLIGKALAVLGHDVDLDDGDGPDEARHGLVILDRAAAARRLRDRGCRIPILLLSKDPGGLEDVETLPKPFDLDELRWEVARVVDPPGSR